MKWLGYFLQTKRKLTERIQQFLLRPLFRHCGKGVTFDPNGLYTFDRISLADQVFIGYGPIFSATNAEIRVGSKTMFGPRVMIFTGDHNTSVIGRHMFDVKDKRPEDDQPVIIEDDVWIGGGVIILKGVTIGRGSIIGAGSVVTRSVPAYSVAAGNPVRVIRRRWDDEDIVEHERRLKISNSVATGATRFGGHK